jgi:hypothetical protein
MACRRWLCEPGRRRRRRRRLPRGGGGSRCAGGEKSVEGAEGAQSGEGGRRELGVRGVRWAVLGAHDGANGLREDPKPIFSDSMSLRRKSTVVIGWLEIT